MLEVFFGASCLWLRLMLTGSVACGALLCFGLKLAKLLFPLEVSLSLERANTFC